MGGGRGGGSPTRQGGPKGTVLQRIARKMGIPRPPAAKAAHPSAREGRRPLATDDEETGARQRPPLRRKVPPASGIVTRQGGDATETAGEGAAPGAQRLEPGLPIAGERQGRQGTENHEISMITALLRACNLSGFCI